MSYERRSALLGISSSDTDDLATIAAWATAVRAEHGVPTRMPSQLANAGELVDRFTGTGTDFPGEAPQYALAPDPVREADHRINQTLGEQVAALVPDDSSAAGFLASLNSLDWGGLAKLGAIGLTLLIVVPHLARSSNPHGLKISRY